MENQTHLLTWMTFFPLIGMAVILITPGRAKNFIKQLALAATLPPLLLGIKMLLDYDPSGGLQFVERVSWIGSFNIFYDVGADGLSVPMLFLTVLLCPICILASWGINDRVKG
ncbi:NADH-quinone oxidoreductase subunit M, partial [bacterium]|nr:NADH-quinone oxidoreductase subunit M [bacterium]